jgi:hypothetical protein
MEGISLFGVAPSLRAVPAGGFVISASHLTSETPPVVGGALMLEEPMHKALWKVSPWWTWQLVPQITMFQLGILVLLRQTHLLVVTTWKT